LKDTEPDKIDTAWLRKRALAFEKRITKNAELRAKFENDPARFIDSEADLDADIKALSILGEHPDLYPEFVRLGCAASLVGLLAHENTDVAISAVEILDELTGEDVAATEEQWVTVVNALLEADLLGLLVSNLGRLDEKEEGDREGVYYALSLVENVCSRQDTAETIGAHTELMKWLLERAKRTESPVTQNKQYAMEILAILVQSSAKNRSCLAEELDAVDSLLQLVAPYRRRDPAKGGEEEEYMENLFEALACIVNEVEGKSKFVEAEGVELCLLMLKEGKQSRPAALRLLDHAVGGLNGASVCLQVVEAGGLKTLFTMFMMKKQDTQTTEHLVAILAWMLRSLPAGSPERIRTLAKFVEKEYEKTKRLVAFRREYGGRVTAVDAQITQESKGLSEEDREARADGWFSRRLDAGLFCLQTVDRALAFLIAEDAGAKAMIQSLLADRDESLDVIKTSIQEQIDEVDIETEEGQDTREMLRTLIEFLQ
jgi:beta-catenin-like protein 1